MFPTPRLPVVTFDLQPVTSHLPSLRRDLPILSGCSGAGDGAVDSVDGALTLWERW